MVKVKRRRPSRTSQAVSAIGRRPLFHRGFSPSSRPVGRANQDDSPFAQPPGEYTDEALLPTRTPEDAQIKTRSRAPSRQQLASLSMSGQKERNDKKSRSDRDILRANISVAGTATSASRSASAARDERTRSSALGCAHVSSKPHRQALEPFRERNRTHTKRGHRGSFGHRLAAQLPSNRRSAFA